MAVGILRLQDGLDYSAVIEGEDPTMSPMIERKSEIRLFRNISAGQLSLGWLNISFKLVSSICYR